MSLDILDSLAFTDDYILPEGIWNKFELDPDLTLGFAPFGLDAAAGDLACLDDCLIQHDCMWTGLCGSKEHNTAEETRAPLAPPCEPKAPAALKQVAGQSVLKPGLRMGAVNPHAVVPMTVLPSASLLVPKLEPDELLQTPPMSDDEEGKPTKTMKILHDAIFDNLESIIEDDGELSDYFKNADEKEFGLLDDEFEEDEDDEEEEEEEDDEDEEEEDLKADSDKEEAFCERNSKNRPFRDYYHAESDHNYHKGTAMMMMQTANLGIETPSDSEEEIDVVSVGEKLNACSKSIGALPTNPSSKDRHQLQRTMQSRFPQGIKTLLPQRRATYAAGAASGAATPSTKRGAAAEAARTPRRPRQYKKYATQRHYKQRRSNYSSDSEVEPSEKRNLHNNMERQRRIDLRNLFEDLKVLVPEVNKKQRAAKVLILRGAAQYCRGLTSTSNALTKQVEDLRRQQERLRAKVSSMRRNLAANR